MWWWSKPLATTFNLISLDMARQRTLDTKAEIMQHLEHCRPNCQPGEIQRDPINFEQDLTGLSFRKIAPNHLSALVEGCKQKSLTFFGACFEAAINYVNYENCKLCKL